MSPEQCVANNVDRRTDVFALGVIGHELLTGRRLFKRASPYETYQAVLECDVKPPSMIEPGLDPGIDAVIMRAITKDKEARYPTTEAFGDALLGYLHHRGISSGPNDVSRFFDANFAQEIDEHSARMRELISGREIVVETGWGKDEEKEELVAAPAKAESDGSMSMLLDGLDLGDLGGGGGDDDDDMPAERTRIEANPLDQINELEKMITAAREASQKSPVTPDEMPSIGAGKDAQVVSLAEPAKPEAAAKRGLPSFARASTAPETQPMAPSSMPGVPPAAVKTMALQIDGPGMGAPPGMPPPEPLGVAMSMGMPMGMPEPDAVRSPPGRFPDAANRPTMLAIPEAEALTHAPKIPPSAQIPLSSGVIGGLPENARTQIAPLPVIPGIDGGMGDGAPPLGYPVMSAEMRSQIEIGATVFPGAPQPQLAGPPMGMPGMHGHGGSQMGMSNMYGQPQMGSGMYVQPPMADPQRAANMMSPVGPQYGNRVDWTAAASAKIRVMPPWLLAILFIAALGLALTLTIVIARLVA
ncbi:MAG TPA: hypothetical protein VGC42_20765 [Kofleriaceae bacterium]